MLESIYINSNSLEMFADTDATSTPHRKSFTKSRPRARIYYQSVGPKLINSIIYAKNLLKNKGIREEEIEEISLNSAPSDVAHQILDRTHLDGKEFPIIFVDDLAIGDIYGLEEWVSSSVASADHSDLHSRFDDVDLTGRNSVIDLGDFKPHKNYRDDNVIERRKSIDKNDNHFKAGSSSKRSSIDPDESITLTREQSPNDSSLAIADISAVTSTYTRWSMRYVGSAISSVANYLTATPSEIPPSINKSPSYIEFEVVQINWYWREQKRILRFADDKFFRLNPFTKELRSVHKYFTIQRIIITGNNFMTISFNDDCQPEYYKTDEMDNMVSTIHSKCETIPISYVNE